MKRVCLVLVLPLCCAAAPFITGCEGDWIAGSPITGVVTGIVTYKDGGPAAGVTVVAVGNEEVVGDEVKRGYETMRTDSSGRYSFKTPSFYFWTISVNPDDPLRAASFTLLAEDDKKTVMDIRLPY